MKKLILFFAIALSCTACFAQDAKDQTEKSPEVVEQEQIITGKVVKIGDNYLIETTNADGSIDRLLPADMPENLKKEGLEVVFSGSRGTIPPNVRVMGVPFELKMIREIEQIQAPTQENGEKE